METKTVPLEDWATELAHDLEDFAQWWVDHAQNNKDFPMSLLPGDWDEQFKFFRETRQ